MSVFAKLIKTNGSLLGLSTTLLNHAPVHTYFWPGIYLLIFMFIWPLINVYGIYMKQRWASLSTTLLGFICVVWIIYETITIRTFSPLQPAIFVIGILLIYGGLNRLEALKPKQQI